MPEGDPEGDVEAFHEDGKRRTRTEGHETLGGDHNPRDIPG